MLDAVRAPERLEAVHVELPTSFAAAGILLLLLRQEQIRADLGARVREGAVGAALARTHVRERCTETLLEDLLVVQELQPIVAPRTSVALRTAADLLSLCVKALATRFRGVGAGRPPPVARVVVEDAELPVVRRRARLAAGEDLEGLQVEERSILRRPRQPGGRSLARGRGYRRLGVAPRRRRPQLALRVGEAADGLAAVPAVAGARLVFGRVVGDLILRVRELAALPSRALCGVCHPLAGCLPVPEPAVGADGRPAALALEVEIEALHRLVKLAVA
mmetsp:Transcript_107015/g.302603  ORF Transcript_107015/g.302603 Transcript_107015/m.302603 type:complete len:277 (-) Transcript_107015:110-940(-)